MQLSASSTFLDLLAASPAAPGGQPVSPAAGLPADATAVAGDFGALLSAQAKPAATVTPATENLHTAPTPTGPGSIITATNASGEGSSGPLDAGMVPGSGTTPPALTAPLSPELVVDAEVSADSALSGEQPASACTAGNAATVKGAPVVGAETAKPRSKPGATAADSVQASARATPWNVPSPSVAARVCSTAQPESATRDAGKTSLVADGHQEVTAQVAAEVTAAWLAANGSTVLVANPAGELIAVDISLSAPDGRTNSLGGLADGTPSTATAAASATVGSGNGSGASLAGNTLPLSEQPAAPGTPFLLNSVPPGRENAPRSASAAALPPPRDERGIEVPTTPSLSPRRPAYPAPGASTQVQVAAATAALAAPTPSSVNVPALNVPVAAGSTPAVTPATEDSALADSGTAWDDAPAAAAPLNLQPVITRAGGTPNDSRTGGMSVATSGAVSQPAIAAASPSVSLPARASEKIAGAFDTDAGASSTVRGAKLKNILAASSEELTNRSARLGINVAQPQARMPALAHPTPSPFADNDAMSFPAVPLTFDTLVQDTAETAAQSFTSSARRAVDSAMAVVDHFSKGAQRGVNLQFSVSGLDLAVRVEMRPDGVHTIFRTDSPELRNALAQEWQSVVNTQSADRSQRLAEPVFTSTSAGGPASGDHGASQQRESGTPQSQWEKATAFAPPAVARAATDVPLAAAATGPRLAPHGTARHLSALA